MFKRFFKLGKLVFLLFLLNACSSQSEQSQDPSHSYIRLSTDQQPSEIDEQENELTDKNLIQPNPDSKQQAVQDEFSAEAQAPNDTGAKNTSDKIEHTSTSIATKLPIKDFKERWNAVTEEQMSNLYIKSLNQSSSKEETIYLSQLTEDMTLHIKVNGEYIQQLEMVYENKSPSTAYTMLSGWSQMINILHPNTEIHDADDFFYKIGVGPNADLKNLKSTTITYFNVEYQVLQTDKGYNLKATINH